MIIYTCNLKTLSPPKISIILSLLYQFTSLEIDEPMFQPFPSDIVFQNFEPYQTYQVPLKLRNNDKVP